MELLRSLCFGSPDFWGGGVSHSLLILALVISFGLILGKIKIRGVSLDLTWVLIIGIVCLFYRLTGWSGLLFFV